MVGTMTCLACGEDVENVKCPKCGSVGIQTSMENNLANEFVRINNKHERMVNFLFKTFGTVSTDELSEIGKSISPFVTEKETMEVNTAYYKKMTNSFEELRHYLDRLCVPEDAAGIINTIKKIVGGNMLGRMTDL